MKGLTIIGIGFLFDAIPFFIGLAIFIIFTFPGTLAGAIGGCAIGGSFLGEAGCKAGAAILSFLGTFANAEIALITVPLGAVVSIVIIDILNIVLGIIFFFILGITGYFHLPYFFMGAIKVIPGFNIFPWFATVAFWSVKRVNKGSKDVEAHMTWSKEESKPKVFKPEPAPPSRFAPEPAPPPPAPYQQQSAPTIMAGSVKIPKSANGIDGIVSYTPPPKAANDTNRAAVERARYKNYKQEPAPAAKQYIQEPAPESGFKPESAPPSKFKPEPAPPPERFKPEPAPPPANSDSSKRNAA